MTSNFNRIQSLRIALGIVETPFALSIEKVTALACCTQGKRFVVGALDSLRAIGEGVGAVKKMGGGAF